MQNFLVDGPSWTHVDYATRHGLLVGNVQYVAAYLAQLASLSDWSSYGILFGVQKSLSKRQLLDRAVNMTAWLTNACEFRRRKLEEEAAKAV